MYSSPRSIRSFIALIASIVAGHVAARGAPPRPPPRTSRSMAIDADTADGPPPRARRRPRAARRGARAAACATASARKPGLGQAYRLGVFVVGLAFIGLGVALAVLPGPLDDPAGPRWGCGSGRPSFASPSISSTASRTRRAMPWSHRQAPPAQLGARHRRRSRGARASRSGGPVRARRRRRTLARLREPHSRQPHGPCAAAGGASTSTARSPGRQAPSRSPGYGAGGASRSRPAARASLRPRPPSPRGPSAPSSRTVGASRPRAITPRSGRVDVHDVEVLPAVVRAALAAVEDQHEIDARRRARRHAEARARGWAAAASARAPSSSRRRRGTRWRGGRARCRDPSGAG